MPISDLALRRYDSAAAIRYRIATVLGFALKVAVLGCASAAPLRPVPGDLLFEARASLVASQGAAINCARSEMMLADYTLSFSTAYTVTGWKAATSSDHARRITLNAYAGRESSASAMTFRVRAFVSGGTSIEPIAQARLEEEAERIIGACNSYLPP